MVSSAFVRMPYRAREDNPLQKEVTQERVFWGNTREYGRPEHKHRIDIALD